MPPSGPRQELSAADPNARPQTKGEATKQRICAAAAGAIAADGYHRTSLTNVVQRAGVSIGALQHHFPTKEDLVVATAEYLLGRSIKWFARAKADLDEKEARDWGAFAELALRSWREQIVTPEYGALLEIFVAARTDNSLLKRMNSALVNWDLAIDKEVRAIFPEEGDAHRISVALTMSRAMMTGLLVHDALLRDERRLDAALKEWTDILKRTDA